MCVCVGGGGGGSSGGVGAGLTVVYVYSDLKQTIKNKPTSVCITEQRKHHHH